MQLLPNDRDRMPAALRCPPGVDSLQALAAATCQAQSLWFQVKALSRRLIHHDHADAALQATLAKRRMPGVPAN
jgi:hypothetical protein